MMDWRVTGIIALFAVAAIYAYEDIQFRKPLTAAEIDGLAAINVGQRECNLPYDLTRKGRRLELRFLAAREADATLQARFMAAQENYRGLDPDEQCALLHKFPGMVRRWHD